MELIELIERIRAVLDEDERIAIAAARRDDGREGSWTPVGLRSAFDARVDDHIARHDPDRVLRQVAAMRKILEYASVMDQDGDYVASMLAEACGIGPESGSGAQMPHAPARIDAERRKGQQ